MELFYGVLPIIAFSACTILGVYVFSQDSHARINRIFLINMTTLGVWAIGDFIIRTAETPSVALAGGRIALIGWITAGPAFIALSLVITGLFGNRIMQWLLGVAGLLSGLFLAIGWATDLLFEGFIEHSQVGYREVPGPLYDLASAEALMTVLISVIILAVVMVRTPSGAQRTKIKFVLIGILLPSIVAAQVVFLYNFHDIFLPVSAVTFGPLMALIIAYAVTRHDLMKPVSSRFNFDVLSRIDDAVMIIDNIGYIESANEAALHLSEYASEDLIGRSITSILPTRLVGPTVRTGSHPINTEFSTECRCRSGLMVPVSATISPLRNVDGKTLGSMVILRDTRNTLRIMEAEREAKSAEEEAARKIERAQRIDDSHEELRKASAFLESVLDNLAEALYIKDADLRFVYANKALYKMTGTDRGQIIGRRHNTMVPDLFPENAKALDLKVLEENVTVRYEVTTGQGTPGPHRSFSIVKTPVLTGGGEATFIAGLIREITEHKDMDSARLDFVKIAAHELRTPLISLQLGFELLAREMKDQLNEQQKRSVASLSASIGRLGSLAANLLDLADLDTGEFRLALKETDLGPVVNEVISLFLASIKEKGLDCSVSIPDELPKVVIDTSRVIQVLNNLLSNAIKNTAKGRIDITVSISDAHFLLVCVSDTGVGIPGSLLDSIFSSFVKAQSIRSAQGGTGIGLSISKAVVEAHGGKIWAESQQGVGSQFYFTLRRADAPGAVSQSFGQRSALPGNHL